MEIKPPKEKVIDKAGKIIKAAVGIVPGGSVAVETLSCFLKLPYERRSSEWQKEVSDTLNHMQNDKGIKLEELQNNEEFLDILLQAIQIGIRNHQVEKRDALKNAIINSAINESLDFVLQQTFLNYIDTFTVWHIKLLHLMNNPKDWFAKSGRGLPGMGHVGSVRGTIENAYPQLRGHHDFVNLIWSDLYNKELLASDKMIIVTGMSDAGAITKRTSGLGEEFIKFITN